jgi:hypothetical protein
MVPGKFFGLLWPRILIHSIINSSVPVKPNHVSPKSVDSQNPGKTGNLVREKSLQRLLRGLTGHFGSDAFVAAGL